MKKLLMALLLCSGAAAYAQSAKTEPTPATNAQMLCSLKHADPNHQYRFTAKPFTRADHSWGYEILADDQLLFHQEDMPGKPKGTGFTSREDALKVAGYIITLLQVPTRPPVAYVADLQRLKLL